MWHTKVEICAYSNAQMAGQEAVSRASTCLLLCATIACFCTLSSSAIFARRWAASSSCLSRSDSRRRVAANSLEWSPIRCEHTPYARHYHENFSIHSVHTANCCTWACSRTCAEEWRQQRPPFAGKVRVWPFPSPLSAPLNPCVGG